MADDSHIWSKTYDRSLGSVFEFHDEMSQAIAEALKFQLEPAATGPKPAAQPKNMEAYECYMKGMHFIKTKYVLTFREEDFRAGVAMFNRAIEIEPDYAMAYFGLCWAYEHHYQVTGDEGDSRLARKNSDILLRLDPNSALGNALRGYMLYEYDGQYEQAFGFLKKALETNANIGEVNFLVGMCYLYAGLFDRGIHFLTRAVELDPYYLWAPYKLACCYMGSGEYEKSALNFDKYFEITPIEPLIWPGRYIALNIWMNRLRKAEEILAGGEKATANAEMGQKVPGRHVRPQRRKRESPGTLSEFGNLFPSGDEGRGVPGAQKRDTGNLFYPLSLLSIPASQSVLQQPAAGPPFL